MAISVPTGTDWQVATDSDFTDIVVNDVGGGTRSLDNLNKMTFHTE